MSGQVRSGQVRSGGREGERDECNRYEKLHRLLVWAKSTFSPDFRNLPGFIFQSFHQRINICKTTEEFSLKLELS